jgi:hypothetical protein
VISSVMLVKSVHHAVYWMRVARTKLSKLDACCKDYISFSNFSCLWEKNMQGFSRRLCVSGFG